MRRDDLAARREAKGFSQEALARRLHVHRTTVQRWENGETTPQPWQRHELAEALEVTTLELGHMLDAGAPGSDWTTVQPPGLDDIEALDLVRRVEASDAGPDTLEALDQAVDQLCRSYTSTPPVELLVPLRAYRGYIGTLLDGRVTLKQRQELMIYAGWVSLLSAICHIDLDHYRAAVANLDAVRSVANEASYPLLAAWADETEAWEAITAGRFHDAVKLCETALGRAGPSTSVHVQVTVQQARAFARLGLAPETNRLLDDAADELDRMPSPENPEHHFVFDPRKLVGYFATTLAWLGSEDQRAEEYAKDAVAQYDVGAADGRWRRRLALARIDLALVLSRLGEPEEAARLGALSVGSGWIVASHLWRLRELGHDLTTRYPKLPEARHYHEQLLALPAMER